MSDELERTARRIWDSRKEIWPDGWLDWDAAIAIQDARVGTYRHFAAAALAEPWWRPISEAPDKRPEWGARIGRWSMGYWLVQDWPMGCERDDLTPIHRYYFPMPQPPEPETAP